MIRLRLGRNASVRQIAAACNIGRTQVSEYLARIDASGLVWPAAGELGEEELRALLFPPETPAQAPSRPLPDWCEVRRKLGGKSVTLMLPWQEYQREFPHGYSYSRHALLYQRWLGTTDLRKLQAHEAGEMLLADWAGQTPSIVEPKPGGGWRANVFVEAMGSSQ